MALDIKSEHIYYTRGDTFEVTITTSGELSEGTRIRFVIARKEFDAPVIDKVLEPDEDGRFVIALSDEETGKLSGSNYKWKATTIFADGYKDTEISGMLTIKWGA